MEPIKQIKALQIIEDDKANLQHLTQNVVSLNKR